MGAPWLVTLATFVAGGNVLIALQYGDELGVPVAPGFGDVSGLSVILDFFAYMGEWVEFIVGRFGLVIPGLPWYWQIPITTAITIGYGWPIINNTIRGSSSE